MHISGLMARKSEFKSNGPGSFPEREEYEFAFQFWYCQPSVKNKAKGLTFFLVWSAFIFGGWVVVAWSRKYCLGLTKIASFVFLVLLKDEGCRVSPRFHLFVSDVNPGNKDARWAQNFLVWPQGWRDYP